MMHSRGEICEALKRNVLIAVVRTTEPKQILPICEALVKGGIHSIEITFTVPDALKALASANEQFGEQAIIGAGTVLRAKQCNDAISAGAQFVVSPIAEVGLVPVAHAAGKPVMLGAYTPTEAQAVYETGADFVKLFPADKLGPSYVKALRAPLPHLQIVPTGGVDLQTVEGFLKAGCVALGIGSSLLTLEILQNNRYQELTRLAEDFVKTVKSYRNQQTNTF